MANRKLKHQGILQKCPLSRKYVKLGDTKIGKSKVKKKPSRLIIDAKGGSFDSREKNETKTTVILHNKSKLRDQNIKSDDAHTNNNKSSKREVLLDKIINIQQEHGRIFMTQALNLFRCRKQLCCQE